MYSRMSFRRCASPSGMTRSRHTSLIERTKRSMKAFRLGLRRGANRASKGHHFYFEKVHGRDGTPVRFQEGSPRHVFAALRGRFDSVFGEDASHGSSPYLVAQGQDDMPEFGVSPPGVFLRKSNHQVSDMLRFWWTPRSTFRAAVVLCARMLPEPTTQSVGCDEKTDFPQNADAG